jgi:hypothetical protein
MPKFNPKAKAPDTDFRDKNAVDRFLECGKFRRCANLEAPPAKLEHFTIYLPACRKSRFDREGFAAEIEMPVPGHRVSPLTYTTLGVWAPLISCPLKCRDYQHPAIAKLKAGLRKSFSWIFEHLIKPSEIMWAAFWAWFFK